MGKLVIAGGDASELLQTNEQAFDQIAVPILLTVVGALMHLEVARRDDAQRVTQGIDRYMYVRDTRKWDRIVG